MNNNKKETLPTKTSSSLRSIDDKLIERWISRKIEVYNGLRIAFDIEKKCVKFEIDEQGKDTQRYHYLLQAKVYDTFGISDINIAGTLLSNCFNSINAININKLSEMKEIIDLDVIISTAEQHFLEIINLFREFRPQDPYEAMMISKLIILDSMSAREFIAANSTDHSDRRTMHQSRGIKLSRLFLEFKERIDKHRKPAQQIHVQYNHIHNEGQAVIGSQINTGGE